MAAVGLLESEGEEMPTTRRRLPRGRMSAGGITETDFIYFTWGSFFDAEDYEQGKTKDELKAFWKKHRAAILERYCFGGRHAGQRPWPFWEWEMPEPRLKVGTQEYWGPWTKNGPPKKAEILDVMEDDEAYLKRVGLLEEWELKKLKLKIPGPNESLREVGRSMNGATV